MGLILIFFRTPAHVQPVPATLTEILLQLDFIGILLMTASLVCYILALQWGGLTLPWNSGAVIATLVLWVVLTIAFFLYEFSIGDYAMISLRLLKRRETWANSLFGYM
jgi:sterol desaturase/sphingolipid hydroxylase (fatty acid hydroxylase superfamily)